MNIIFIIMSRIELPFLAQSPLLLLKTKILRLVLSGNKLIFPKPDMMFIFELASVKYIQHIYKYLRTNIIILKINIFKMVRDNEMIYFLHKILIISILSKKKKILNTKKL